MSSKSNEVTCAASEVQKQFWMIHQMHPESPAYNIAALNGIKGGLNQDALAKSLGDIIERHQTFRTHFALQGEELIQVIEQGFELNIAFIDVSSFTGDELETEANKLITEAVNRPFKLTEGPLIRVSLYRLSENEFRLLIVMHHIITDLATKDMFAAELSHLYAKHTGQSVDNLELTRTNYSDYAEFQKAELARNNYEPLARYWEKALEEQSGYLNLPLDFTRPGVKTERGDSIAIEIPEELTASVRELCAKHLVNPFVFLLSVYYILLSRFSGQEDVIVGVPLTNRRKEEFKSMLGCFVNILPLGLKVSPDKAVHELIQDVRLAMLGAHRNQEIPFGLLVQKVKPKRDSSYNPLFQAGFTFEHPMTLDLAGLETGPLEIKRFGSQLDLFLNLWEEQGTIRGHFEFNTDLFQEESIQGFASSFLQLLEGITKDDESPIAKLPILKGEQQRQILEEWNGREREYPLELSLSQLFEAQAAKSGDGEALVFQGKTLSYNELNSRANQLAAKLRAAGVQENSIVGVFMNRSLEMVVSLLGILKAGGAYLPLEPELPAGRLSLMLEDAQPALILTSPELEGTLPAGGVSVLILDSEFKSLDSEESRNLELTISPESPAYVIYTSGSTGKPKGVVVPHKGIANRLHWMDEYFTLKAEDRVLQKTPFSFDVSVWEFFWTLCFGAVLVLAEPESHRDSSYLTKLIQEQNISIVHFVPSMLEHFLGEPSAANCTSLRYVVCSGEALPYSLQERFFSLMENTGASLYNLYGPTEASVDVTAWKCKKDSKIVPIGFPIANTQIYILDSKLQLVAPGVVGDLYIGGTGLALGYLNREELTASVFIPHPFDAAPGARIYKTGDLARRLRDGSIDYIGRRDSQIQLRGLRIELGEIEAVLEEHSEVERAAVLGRKDIGDDVRLCIYYTHVAGANPEVSVLRDFLKGRLPSAFVPSYFTALDVFPMTSSGKINRKALPAPADAQPGAAKGGAPVSEVEKQIFLSWKEALGMENIGVNDNFFDLGGHSMLLARVQRKIIELYKPDITMVEMFQYPTIASMAGYLGKDNKNDAKEESFAGLGERSKKQRSSLKRMKRSRP